MTLSSKQTEAARRTGQDVCVVAGPGSGKTRVLVERFQWLVEHQRVSPVRILAITFTEKAATEIKERLSQAFEGNPALRGEIERAPVSTVHGFCARLLKENAIAAGLDPQFSVMDEPVSRAELVDAARQALDQLVVEDSSRFRALLEAIHVSAQFGGRQPDLADSLLNVYQAMRVAGVENIGSIRARDAVAGGLNAYSDLLAELRGLLAAVPAAPTKAQSDRLASLLEWLERASALDGTPVSTRHFELLEEFPRNYGKLSIAEPLRTLRDERIPEVAGALAGELYAPLRCLLWEALERAERIYRQRKRDMAAVDFSDLEERAIELLRSNPRVQAAVSRSFEHILMDELQDTNRLQWTLLDLVRTPDRFFAVGDVNQSIYGFRHADPEVFKEYRRGLEAAGKEIDKLYENHRSRADILSAAGLIVRGAQGIEPHELHAARAFGPKGIPSVEVIACSGNTGDEAATNEARLIASRIKELVGSLPIEDGRGGQRPATYRDMAVLARKRSALAPIKGALDDAGIPCLPTGGRTFYQGREVKDLIHLLRVVDNAADEVALAGVLRSPLVGVSDESLLRLKRLGPLAGALARLERRENASQFDPADLERLRRFRALLGRMREDRDDVSPDRLLARAIDEVGYETPLDSRGRANVEKLLGLLREWRSRNALPISRLVEDLEWMRDSQSEPDAPPDDSSDVVRLMSIHQAKGLQFPVVFLPALQKGGDSTRPPVCFSRDTGLGVRWRNPYTYKAVEDPAHLRFSEIWSAKEAHEEDRLLYVAMTRAEEHLVFSFAQTKRPASAWWKMVTAGLGVALDTVDSEPVLHAPPGSDFTVRVLRADGTPDNQTRETIPAAEREDLVFVSPPAVSGQYDSTVSVTSLVTFASCPRKYYLGQYLGWQGGRCAASLPEVEVELGPDFDESPDRPDAAEFGRQVHMLLAGAEPANVGPEALELAARFHASDLGRRVARAARVEKEFDFLLAMHDTVLRGQIDLWFEDGGELLLVDYKTDDVVPDAARDRAHSYALQLRLYALALEHIAGRLPDLALVCLLRPGAVVPIGLDRASLEGARAAVRDFLEAQTRLDFPLHEGEQCRRCPFYKGLCPAR